MSENTGLQPAPRAPGTPLRIVIVYRRDDMTAGAHRLHGDLTRRFGPKSVFIDIDSIPPGADWAEEIRRTITSSDVLLAVIGRYWLDIRDDGGGRRLDDPSDTHRIELETALESGLWVIPVQIDGAPMPKAEELPTSIAALASRHSVQIDSRDWDMHVNRLARELEAIGKPSFSAERSHVPDVPGPPSAPAPARRIVRMLGHRKRVREVAWSPDGSRLLTAADDGTARTWDPTNARELSLLEFPSGWGTVVGNMVFSADGRLFATNGTKGLRVFELESGRCAVSLGASTLFALAFAPHGGFVASTTQHRVAGELGSQDRPTIIDASTGAEIVRLPFDARVLAVSPDGRFLAGRGAGPSSVLDVGVSVWDGRESEDRHVFDHEAMGNTF